MEMGLPDFLRVMDGIVVVVGLGVMGLVKNHTCTSEKSKYR
jgi:siroheme synthase (precorrin-2 oxidase/ferrochelatase)